MRCCGAGVLYSAQPPALQSHLHQSLPLQRRRLLSRRSTAARLSVIIIRLANSKIVLTILLIIRMKRVWTAQTIHDWVARRDAYREQRKKPSMAALRESVDVKDRQAYERELATERKVLKERLDDLSTTFAWAVRRHGRPPRRESIDLSLID